MSDRALIYLGDIHGGFHKVVKYIEKNDIKGVDILQVGDFGVGFHSLPREKQSMSEFNVALGLRDVNVYAIRGNHDDPSYFEEDPFQEERIKLISDNTILELGGRKILCVGGAISIDRLDRIRNNWGYWEDEDFVFDKEVLDSLDLSEVDTIVTHSSPKFCSPTTFGSIVYNYANQDAGLIRDLDIERDLITEFYEYVKPKMPKLTEYYYGHFHYHKTEVHDGVKFRLLDIDEFA